jgi:hypothetical protein
MEMKKILLAAVGLAALIAPAQARLQLSINASGSTFTCFDGQLGCDLSGGANNLLLVNQTVGAAFVQIALAQSAFGAINQLQLSSSNIVNNGTTPLTVTLLASDTDFVGPVHAINNSGSLTFNQNIGAPDSTLRFWADAANVQGANPLNTPGLLLESVSGHAVTDPDSFAGSLITPFDAAGPYSMTEGAALILRSGGSITGFNQAMESTAVPEPRTWAMLGIGFGLMALMGFKGRKNRLASLA